MLGHNFFSAASPFFLPLLLHHLLLLTTPLFWCGSCTDNRPFGDGMLLSRIHLHVHQILQVFFCKVATVVAVPDTDPTPPVTDPYGNSPYTRLCICPFEHHDVPVRLYFHFIKFPLNSNPLPQCINYSSVFRVIHFLLGVSFFSLLRL